MKRDRKTADPQKGKQINDQRSGGKSGSQKEGHGKDRRSTRVIKQEPTPAPRQEPEVAEIKREEGAVDGLEQTRVEPSNEVVGQDLFQEELAALFVALEPRIEDGLKVDARRQRDWEESQSGRSGHDQRPMTLLDRVFAVIDVSTRPTKYDTLILNGYRSDEKLCDCAFMSSDRPQAHDRRIGMTG
ncbi:hypothetical protein CALVIDRAFT_524423 [Calocera viscosa TUFC12733]|uniref:Uncharacterized protein n=1 Tax=Calocera viscosa (strain TUFC12733) TaxID=1330018 RepID=A0A167RWX4_CALVF|nr:hypothetical protein CALVIDRAFT_524423 [Calocera viscosa TUFC12733]